MNNIAFFVTGLDSGGLENYLLRFLQYKASSFNRVIVFCKGGKRGQLEKQYSSIPNVTIVSKNIGYFNIFHYIYLLIFFRKNNITTVCDFTGNFAGLVLLAAKVSGIKIRVSFYRGSSNHFKETIVKILYNSMVRRLTYMHASHILSNSIAAFDFFFPGIWKEDDRFEVIYNGIAAKTFIEETGNLRSEFGIPDGAFVVGHTGRFNVAKNHKTILKVAMELCTTYDNVYFFMCGNGVGDNISNMEEVGPFKNRIIAVNNRTDIPRVLNTLDCYYFPSLTEGQPNALLEAMLVGLPIVASDIDSIKETVPKYLYTQLISANDYKLAVKKIIEIKDKKPDGNDYDTRKWVIENYSPAVLFEKFYEKLV